MLTLAARAANQTNHNLLRKENKNFELSKEYFLKSLQRFECQDKTKENIISLEGSHTVRAIRNTLIGFIFGSVKKDLDCLCRQMQSCSLETYSYLPSCQTLISPHLTSPFLLDITGGGLGTDMRCVEQSTTKSPLYSIRVHVCVCYYLYVDRSSQKTKLSFP